MLKLIKGIFLFLLFGIVLLIALGTVFVYFFDANDYKDQFISYVEEHSKRSVELETLNLTLFPSLGIAATGLQIGENPAFGDEPFLEAQEIQLGLKLLPLLKQEAQVDGIVLKGIKANVVRDDQGQFNFDDLKLLVGESQTTTDNTTTDSTATDASQAVALTSFGGVALQDSYLLWHDRLTNTRIAVDNLNFNSGALSLDEPTPISLNADVNSLSEGLAGLNARVALNSEFLPDLSTNDVKIGDVNIQMQVTQANTPLVADINAKVGGLELKGGTLAADKAIPIELDARANGLSQDNKVLAASLKVKTELLPDLAAAVIQLNNLDTLAQVEGLDESLGLQLAAESNKALLEGAFAVDRFKVSYGDMQVQGRANFSDLYGNPRADIAIPTLNYDALQLKQILLTSSMIGERILLDLQRANFHQGRISGNVELNSVSNAYQMSLSADQVPIDKLQAALSADRQATIRGQAQVKLALAGTLGDYNQVLATSNGRANVRITDGALQDESLAAIIERIVALFEGRSRRAAGEELIFGEMTGSAVLNKGIAKNDDLAVQMPLFDVKGSGQVNLINSTLDYMLYIQLKSAGWIQVPIRISGNLESPEYKPDFSNLIKDGLFDKSTIQKKVEETVDDVEKTVGNTVDDIEQKIEDTMKGGLLEGLKDKLKLPF